MRAFLRADQYKRAALVEERLACSVTEPGPLAWNVRWRTEGAGTHYSQLKIRQSDCWANPFDTAYQPDRPKTPPPQAKEDISKALLRRHAQGGDNQSQTTFGVLVLGICPI